MNKVERINAFVKLGEFFSQFNPEREINKDSELNEKYFDEFNSQINKAVHHNGWFTKDNVLFAIEEWSNLLTEPNLESWLSKYPDEVESARTIGLVMAGNIPLVGFHDFICVLISGHNLSAKLSSNDKQFFPIIASILIDINEEFKNRITFRVDKLENYDAVIATGSNNTARYFKHYFKNVPNIIRQNRNSVAVLSGEESKEDLLKLGEDIFRYFGLGCRSVSKIYVPQSYDFDKLFNALYSNKDIINHAKYANNYDYNKAVYLMSEKRSNLLDNGFFLLKEDNSFGSPIATLFYEFYSDKEELEKQLLLDDEKIQCVVSTSGKLNSSVEFGQSQHPSLHEYADGVDTVEFLHNLGN